MNFGAIIWISTEPHVVETVRENEYCIKEVKYFGINGQ